MGDPVLPVYKDPKREMKCERGKKCAFQAAKKMGELLGSDVMSKSWPEDAWFNRAHQLKLGGQDIWTTDQRANMSTLPASVWGKVQVGDYMHFNRKGSPYEDRISTKGYANERVEHAALVVGKNEEGVPMVFHGSDSGQGYVQPVNETLTLGDHGYSYWPFSLIRSGALVDHDFSGLENHPYYRQVDIDPKKRIEPTEKATPDMIEAMATINQNQEQIARYTGATQDEVLQAAEILMGISQTETKGNTSWGHKLQQLLAVLGKNIMGIGDDEASRGMYRMKPGKNITGSVSRQARSLGVTKDNYMKGIDTQTIGSMVALLDRANTLKNEPAYNPESNTFNDQPFSYALAKSWQMPNFHDNPRYNYPVYGPAADIGYSNASLKSADSVASLPDSVSIVDEGIDWMKRVHSPLVDTPDYYSAHESVPALRRGGRIPRLQGGGPVYQWGENVSENAPVAAPEQHEGVYQPEPTMYQEGLASIAAQQQREFELQKQSEILPVQDQEGNVVGFQPNPDAHAGAEMSFDPITAGLFAAFLPATTSLLSVKGIGNMLVNPAEGLVAKGVPKLAARKVAETNMEKALASHWDDMPRMMSTTAPKGNMHGQHPTIVQQARLLHPETKAKYFEHKNMRPSEVSQGLLDKPYTNDSWMITPKNYESFVRKIHGHSTTIGKASEFGKKPINLGVGKFNKQGVIYTDAPISNMQKGVIEAHEKNHGVFAGTLSEAMKKELRGPFGGVNPFKRYSGKNADDEILARMGQFKNAIGMGDDQVFTLGHLNLIREKYANRVIDNNITEMLSKIPEGSSRERMFLRNMNKFALGATGAATGIGVAADEPTIEMPTVSRHDSVPMFKRGGKVKLKGYSLGGGVEDIPLEGATDGGRALAEYVPYNPEGPASNLSVDQGTVVPATEHSLLSRTYAAAKRPTTAIKEGTTDPDVLKHSSTAIDNYALGAVNPYMYGEIAEAAYHGGKNIAKGDGGAGDWMGLGAGVITSIPALRWAKVLGVGRHARNVASSLKEIPSRYRNYHKYKEMPDVHVEKRLFNPTSKEADQLIETAVPMIDKEIATKVARSQTDEGFKRLVQQEREYLQELGVKSEVLDELSVKAANARINELKNMGVWNRPGYEAADEIVNFTTQKASKSRFEPRLKDNAFYKPPQKTTDVWDQAAKNKHGTDDLKRIDADPFRGMFNRPAGSGKITPEELIEHIIDLSKTKQLGIKTVPGSIGIGVPYLKSPPVVHHELGHALQRGRLMPIDNRLRSIRTKEGLTKSEERAADYFRKGSSNREPSAFAHELREAMLKRGLIKKIDDPIDVGLLERAKKSFGDNPMGVYNLSNDFFLSNTRLLDIADPNYWNLSKISQELNKLPLSAAGAATGIGVASQVNNQ